MANSRRSGFAALAVAVCVGGTLTSCADEAPRYQIVAIQPTPNEVRERLDAKAAEIAAEPQVEGLPRRLSHWLRTRHPDYTVLPRASADAYMARYAVEDLGQESPFVCFGDFDGNGLNDAAAIVRDQTRDQLKFFAFHQVRVTVSPGDFEDRGYRAHQFGGSGAVASASYDGLVVACREPGRYEEVEGRYALELRNHSIAAGFSLFYFDGADYRSIIIAD